MTFNILPVYIVDIFLNIKTTLHVNENKQSLPTEPPLSGLKTAHFICSSSHATKINFKRKTHCLQLFWVLYGKSTNGVQSFILIQSASFQQ